MPAGSDRTAVWLQGTNPEPGLVAVEHLPGPEADAVRLFFRDGERRVTRDEPFRPFLWLEDAALLDGAGMPPPGVTPLAGRGPLRALAEFPTWTIWEKAVAALKRKTGRGPGDAAAPYLAIRDPVQQYLLRSGRTFFQGMRFADLRRAQVDIETLTTPGYAFTNAERAGDRIVAIALATGPDAVEVLAQADEAELLRAFVARLRALDPDVIEGHNLFAFDLEFLAARAQRHGVALTLGREDRLPAARPSRFTAGDRAVAYPRRDLFGRHIVDTYFLTLAYDVTHRALAGHGLKEVARHFGLARPDRTYIPGAEIARIAREDPARLERYVRDDARETRALSDLLSPVYFAQAQWLPFGYQDVCLRGNAAKIDALMQRAYLAERRALPRPGSARPFAGGYTDIFLTGLARPVRHADIRSLYPSLMLRERIGPAADDGGVFLSLLDALRTRRLRAKDEMRRAADPAARLFWDAQQSTAKVLINSFYGYLGFEMARWNDFDAAERVTAAGRALLRALVEKIRALGAAPVEIDTDGIYYIPPADGDDAAFESAVRAGLPEGIEIEFDGRYEAMFSYKMKNYALLDEKGEIVLRGAALKSRGLEPFQREFLRDWLELRLRGRDEERRALRETYRRRIAKRTEPIAWLARTETLQDAPATYAARRTAGGRGRNAAYELAQAADREYRAGDRVSYYVAGDRKNVAVYAAARLVSDWNPERRDENVAYYLSKLDELADRLEAVETPPAAPSGQGELSLG